MLSTIRRSGVVHMSTQTTTDANPKLDGIVDQVSTLTLLETSQLIQLLKTRLNIQDIAMPMMAAPTGAGAATPAAAETEFTLKLDKFDAASKAKLIREIKGILPGANLIEVSSSDTRILGVAKKFVEGAPKIIRENVPKEEAEKIKKALEAVGGTVTME
ncbi:hypothetical protein BDF22DRAFT_697850 [Syncephalis plumigaleata]|nr:hypothetical protein BDF22DRAFT_697850 [Syncephalis plumigaleata]